jgi:hypothetical protein
MLKASKLNQEPIIVQCVETLLNGQAYIKGVYVNTKSETCRKAVCGKTARTV